METAIKNTLAVNGKDETPISWDYIHSFELTDESKIPDIEPVVKIGESLFAVKGDISVIGGLPKAGKTAMSVYILGTALKEFPIDEDTLSIRSAVSSAPIIYIDTEQSKAITNKLKKTILQFIGEEKKPSNLHIYNFRGIPSAERKLQCVKYLFNHFKEQRPHLWVIDGLADLVKNPNDIAESFGTITEFMALAENSGTSIIFYLHENPGVSQKLRGNLGSEIERKCFGAITVRKDREKGIHWIEPRMLRASSDFDKVYFTYDVDKGRMRSLTESERNEAEKGVDQEEKKRNQFHMLALLVTENGKSMPMDYQQIVHRITGFHHQAFGKNLKPNRKDKSTEKHKLAEMVSKGFIIQDDKGLYSLKKEDE